MAVVQVAADVNRRNYRPGARSTPAVLGSYAIADQSMQLPEQSREL